MPDGWNACGALDATGRARVVADYIAGMTDRYALREHGKMGVTCIGDTEEEARRRYREVVAALT